jgi:thiamine biosynthesis lipoprotein
LAAIVVAAAFASSRWGQGAALHEFGGPTMGSFYHVTVDADLTTEDHQRIQAVIDERFERLERLLSSFDSTSEVSRFNKHTSTEPFPVSAEVIELLAITREVSERSGGALDVTVAPLVDAWGFGPVERTGPVPDETRLAELLALVGYEGIVLDETAGTVAKVNPAMHIDLSAVGQGYAADEVAEALAGLGLTRFLVELSGELKAVGTRRDGRAWRVGIEAPHEAVRELWGTVDLTDEGVATSGDYRNYVEIEGVRYAHLVDPRSGRAVRMVGAAVTVVHPSAAVADAWDTALAVLGPEAGYALAEREGLAALFITRAGDRFEAKMTSALAGRTIELRD